MNKLDMSLYAELVDYWLNDLTATAKKIGYMESSYEAGGVESVIPQIGEEKKNLAALRKKIRETLIKMFGEYQAGE